VSQVSNLGIALRQRRLHVLQQVAAIVVRRRHAA